MEVSASLLGMSPEVVDEGPVKTFTCNPPNCSSERTLDDKRTFSCNVV